MKPISAFVIVVVCSMLPAKTLNAQIPIIDIIKQGVKKVIVAVDLQIQRLQTKTIWLQNAQKVVENEMSKLKLTEITDWVQKQKDLYQDYFDELWQVKSVITYYNRVQDIIKKQVQIVEEYKHAFALFQQDENFTPDEIEYISKVYAGILDESLKNIDQVLLVIDAFATQMDDAKRLEIINNTADRVDENYNDLKLFNNENIKVSLQRAKEKNNVDVVKKLYGLE